MLGFNFPFFRSAASGPSAPKVPVPDMPLDSPGNQYLAYRASLADTLRQKASEMSLGRYEIMTRFQGGQGSVQIGRHENGEYHAIKTYFAVSRVGYRRGIMDEAFRSHFSASEAEWGVLPLLDVMRPKLELYQNHDEGNAKEFAITPFCWAGSLADRMAHSNIPRDEALLHSLSIATALQSIHAIGISHLDLKPGNLLFWDGTNCGLEWTGYGLQLILTDFGSAQGSKEAGLLPGPLTPAYAAPEQHGGGRPTSAADIWAWACITYELFANKPAFVPPMSSGSSAAPAVSDSLRQIDWRNADAPEWIKDLVHAAMAGDPKRRPATEAILSEFSKYVAVSDGGSIVGNASSFASAFRNGRLALHLRESLGWHCNTEGRILRIKYDSFAAVREAMTSFQTGTEAGLRSAMARIERTFGSPSVRDSLIARFVKGEQQSEVSSPVADASGASIEGSTPDIIVEVALDVQCRALFSLVEDFAIQSDIEQLSALACAWDQSGRFGSADHAITCAQALAITGFADEAIRLYTSIDGKQLDDDNRIRWLKSLEASLVAVGDYAWAADVAYMLSLQLLGAKTDDALKAMCFATIYARMADVDLQEQPLARLSDGARNAVTQWMSRSDLYQAFDLCEKAEIGDFDQGAWAELWPYLEQSYFQPNTTPMRASFGIKCASLYGQKDFACSRARYYMALSNFSLPLYKPFFDVIVSIANGAGPPLKTDPVG